MSVAKITLKIELPVVDAIENALDAATRTEISQLIADKTDPYVPYKTGALANNVTVTPDSITYHQPYAGKNYFGEDIAHNPQYHPLATAKWDKVMLQEQGEELTKEVRDIIIRRLDEEIHGRG